jgi:hypothetical protein
VQQRNGIEQLTAVPNCRNAEGFNILRGQVWQDPKPRDARIGDRTRMRSSANVGHASS